MLVRALSSDSAQSGHGVRPGGPCADPVNESRAQLAREGRIFVGGGIWAVTPLYLVASQCHPVCGPLPATRRQLPAVINYGMNAGGLLPDNQHGPVAGYRHVALPAVVTAAPGND